VGDRVSLRSFPFIAKQSERSLRLFLLARGYRGGIEGLSRGFRGPWPSEPPRIPYQTLTERPLYQKQNQKSRSEEREMRNEELGMRDEELEVSK